MSAHIMHTSFILLRRFLLNGEEEVVPSAEIDRCRWVYVNWLCLGVLLHAESHSRKGFSTDFLNKYHYSHGYRFPILEWQIL